MSISGSSETFGREVLKRCNIGQKSCTQYRGDEQSVKVQFQHWGITGGSIDPSFDRLLDLSTLRAIDHLIYGPFGPPTLVSMDPWIYGLLDPSTLGSMDPWIYGPMDLWTLGSIDHLVHRLLDLPTLGSIDLLIYGPWIHRPLDGMDPRSMRP